MKEVQSLVSIGAADAAKRAVNTNTNTIIAGGWSMKEEGGLDTECWKTKKTNKQ